MKSTAIVLTVFLMTRVWVYGQGYTYTDLGSNLPVSTGTLKLTDMSWVSQNEGWICSANTGEIYRTQNGGSGFTTQIASNSPTVHAIFMLNSQEGFATGDMARVMHTTDGGNVWGSNWYAASDLLALSFPPGSPQGFACGNSGWIFSVSASGIGSMGTPYNITLQDICFHDPNNGWVCGNNKIGHYTSSLGWINDQTYPQGSFNAIFMVDNTTGWAVGAEGIIVKTNDGIHWNAQNNPDVLHRNLNDVCFVDSQKGFAVGDGGLILTTSDGGDTWNVETGLQTTRNLNVVQFPVPAVGYIAGDSATLIKCADQSIGIGPQKKGSPEPALSISPNPASDHANISLNIPAKSYVTLRLYDLFGRLVTTFLDKELAAGATTVPCRISGIPRDIYICRMESSAGNCSTMLVVE